MINVCIECGQPVPESTLSGLTICWQCKKILSDIYMVPELRFMRDDLDDNHF